MLAKLKKQESGFTIIEVMIVLAIAALILVVVLIAVPQLQRNQRNSARRNILSRVKAEVDNYSGNNNGAVPLSAADVTSFSGRYLSGVNTNDPSSGTAMSVSYVTTAPTSGQVPAATQGTISYRNGFKCDGENLVTGTARQYAIWTQLEGGAIACFDNS